MNVPESIRNEKDFQECVKFHGHTCMGVTIGYLAAKLAMKLLEHKRSIDEELITIVENDACCCDAIQVLTGCTFGKGNFFFKDYGKMAFTFGNRSNGKAIRLLLKPEVFGVPEQEQILLELIRSSKASPEDIKNYETMTETRETDLFSGGPEAFFDVQDIEMTLPPTASRAPSTPCVICGEMVLQTKLDEVGGQLTCKSCQE